MRRAEAARDAFDFVARGVVFRASLNVRRAAATLALCATSLVSGALAIAQSAPTPRTLSVDELRPGMRGYGLTVFSGTRPERFDVEVVGTLRNFRPRQDLVLIRTTHPILQRANTVGGMSGSPIYVDDKLVGAYAYGWEFGSEPIAGVTPIANMLAELARPRRTPAGMVPGFSAPVPIGGPGAQLDPGASRRTAMEESARALRLARAPVPTPHGALSPLSVPLSVAGMSTGAVRYLSEAFEPMGIVPLQAAGTGGATTADAPSRYEPGGSVGVQLISGDISSAGTGTVTWVRGAEVLGFGHPMMELGEVALPATVSRVSWILASTRRSFKIAEPLRTVGALVQDRPSTIVVDERVSAPTVPMRVRLLNNPGAPHNEWNVQVAYHRALFARLVGSVVVTALETSASESSDAAFTVEARVHTRDRGVLSFTDVGVTATGPASVTPAAMSFFEAVDRLTDNPFETVRIDRVEVDIRLRFQRELYFVRNVALSQSEVDPGRTVQLLVSLGQYAGAPITRTIPVEVPREMAGREMEIEVLSGSEAVPDLAEPETVDDLVRNLTTSYPDDALVVQVRRPGQGALIRGRALYNLPGSAFDALRPGASTDGAEPLSQVQRTVVPLGRVVIGRDRVRLRVRELRQ
jgi:hypothetical protein